MDEAEASGHVWQHEVRRRAPAQQDRDALACLLEYDADPFEVELYKPASDPQTLRSSTAPSDATPDSTSGTSGG